MKSAELKKIFQSFCDYRILVIGDVMIDSYMWGKVDRISPEAPIPIIASTKYENRLGGAANVALNIKSFNAQPLLFSVIGDDDPGIKFLQRLGARDIDPDGIIISSERKTTVKTRIISNNQHLLRVDEEDDRLLSDDLQKQLVKKIIHQIDNQPVNAIIFEDYDKGVITPYVIEEVTKSASSAGIPVLADPKKRNFSNYRDLELFKPNFRELVEGLKLDLKKGDMEGLFNAARMIHSGQNIKLVMVSLSELGVFISDGQKYFTVPAEVRDISDVSGAGDTLISTTSLFLAAGFSPRDIAGIANLAGGLVCEKVGVVPIDKDNLLEELLIRNINGYTW